MTLIDAQPDYPPAKYSVLTEDEYGFRQNVRVVARDQWQALKVCKALHPELSPLVASYIEEVAA